jgi:hypothetical protein
MTNTTKTSNRTIRRLAAVVLAGAAAGSLGISTSPGRGVSSSPGDRNAGVNMTRSSKPGDGNEPIRYAVRKAGKGQQEYLL